LLAELHLAALNRAKKEEKLSLDLLARLAVTKFLRTEMSQQFPQVLERCRVLLKSYEGIRQGKAVEYRERVAAFQVRKKIILRKTGPGSVRDSARYRERNPGPYPPVIFWRAQSR